MTEYQDALQYFERKRDSAKKRYEAALRRGDETQALQLKVKARRMEVAVETIESRIEKPVARDENGWLGCPTCREWSFLTNDWAEKNAFCGGCGQALDWGEEE